jgi:putative ABC transport system substrate-binding protein
MAVTIGRRKFLRLAGGVGWWPLVARAEQTEDPVIGFLSSGGPVTLKDSVSGFRDGLDYRSYIQSRNVTVIYRWAENQLDRLPHWLEIWCGRRSP